MSAPRVTIAMPVHNAMPYLVEGVASILTQTLEDFEFLIVDDRSTDGSGDYLRDAARGDARIRLIDRRGESFEQTSNLLVSAAQGSLVARMDADDISRRDRLERQVEVMDAAPDVVLTGSLADGIDATGRRVHQRDRWRLIHCLRIPFPHGSSMYRREAFDAVGGYRNGTAPWEDVDLSLRLARHGRVLVLPDALYSYRYHIESVSHSRSIVEAARATDRRGQALAAYRAGQALPEATPDPTSPPSRGAIATAQRERGALRVWSGQRPAPVMELFRSGGLSWSPRSAGILLRTGWGRLSPGSMRASARTLIRVRDAAAGAWVGKSPREWRFGG